MKETNKATTIDRRTFIGGAALFGASIATGAFLSGCSSAPDEGAAQSQDKSAQADPTSNAPLKPAANTDSLVVYFSHPETDDPNNMTEDEENTTVVVDGVVLGNTQYVANLIQERTGADMFRIEPAVPYTTDHDPLVAQIYDEQERGFRPELASVPEGLDAYDTIYFGYPTWCTDLPPVVHAFLETVDLAGKTIVPFNTHGGSGFAGTIAMVQDAQPDATVLSDGYMCSRDRMETAPDGVAAWLNDLEL
ncbi:flavodoxin [Raoultibacter timonensis]|uniref:flavodoxin n=1 Tax=Raoultibacter timonensis TaxID=1907662 RepID=UPI0026DB50D1|nr:flavodoxin [Raoultibacter timonensis]